jgi:hypothetical protein
MVRTVISLDERDKRWLDRRAAKEGVPMTELIRRAVAMLKERVELEEEPLEKLLERTRGTWLSGDGLEYQERIRGEW